MTIATNFDSMPLVIVKLAALVGMQFYAPRKSLLPAMGVTIALDLIGASLTSAAPLCIALIVVILFFAWFRAQPSIRAWRADSRNPLVLDAPFEGRWIVAAGGPAPGMNHHLIASDQRCAYDFFRRDAKSFGSAILAPL